MSGFLIDTNVLSEYNRPGNPDAGVKRWLETTERTEQYVSVITPEQFARAAADVAGNGPWPWRFRPPFERS